MRSAEGVEGAGIFRGWSTLYQARLKHLCIGILSLLLLSSSAALAGEPLSEILKGIRERYSHLPGLSVPYQREIMTRSMAMLGEPTGTDLASGRMYFKPPYFLKVQQDTPRPETLTADGNFLWWYVPEKNQVYRYPYDALGQELRLLSDIFRGLRRAEETFDLSLLPNDKKGEYQVRLTPNPPWQEVEYIVLAVSEDDHTIRVVEIHDYIGGITRFILGDVSVRESFEEGFFSFVVPEGARVIEQ